MTTEHEHSEQESISRHMTAMAQGAPIENSEQQEWQKEYVAQMFEANFVGDTVKTICAAHNAALAAARERADHNAEIGDAIARASKQTEDALRGQLFTERQRREQAGNALEHIDTVALAVSGFAQVANAISAARVILQ